MEVKDESQANAGTPDEVGNWFFSMVPVGVAFAFYMVFVLYAKLENANLFIAFGAAASAIGLQSFWIIRGFRNGDKPTVVMGFAGIGIIVGVLYAYLYFL
ncbi:MAG: hypothetical protein RPU34_04200 [Candidatus Sedimenticola sp. (ex Thyasira tokunagai)]